MSWLGGGISQLTGQISNFTREVLSEGTEEVSDHVSELKVTKDKIQELDLVVSSQKSEIERLKQLNHELEEKAESSELQINTISKEYRNLLEEKEGEVKALKQKQNELLEIQKKMAASAAAWGSTAFSHSTSTSQLTSPYVQQSQQTGLDLDHHDGMDFGDVISSQHEINQLSQQVHSLQAEVDHWRQVAASLGGLHGEQEGGQNQGEIHKLKQEVQELRHQLHQAIDDHQHELTTLQDVHSEKLTALKRQQRQETKQLQEEIADLQQQLDQSFSNSGEDYQNEVQGKLSEYKSQLSAALQEKEMAEQELEKSRTGEKEKTRKLQALTKQMEGLQKQKQELTEHIESLSKAEKQLQQELSTATEENKRLKNDLAQQTFGSSPEVDEGQVQANQDDQRLQEENGELKAQVQQLQKELETVRGEQERYQTAMEDLRLELLEKNSLRRTDSEETLEQTTDNSANITGSFGVDITSSTPLHPRGRGYMNQASKNVDSDTGSIMSTASDISWKNRQLDEQVHTLQSQIDKYEEEIEQFEMVQSDWQVEKQALEDVLNKLRGQLRQKEESLNVVQAAKVYSKGLIEVGKHERKLQRAGQLGSPPVEMISEPAASCASPAIVETGEIQSESPVPDTDRLEHERDVLLLQKNQLEQEVQQLRGQLQQMDKAQHDASVEALSQEKTNAKLEELQSALLEKTNELREVTEEKDALVASLDELDSQHQEALMQVLKTRDDLKNQLSASVEHVGQLQEQVKSLGTEKQQLSLELSSLQTASVSNSMVEDEINRLRNQLLHSTEEKDQLVNTRNNLTEQLTELRQQLMEEQEAASHKVEHFEMELNTSRSQVQELSIEKTKLMQQLQVEEEMLKQKELDLSQEHSKVNLSANEAQQLTQEKAQLIREIEMLQDQLDEGGRSLSRLQAEKGKLTHTVSSLHHSLEDLRATHEALKAEKVDLSKTCVELESKLHSAETQIHSLEDSSRTESESVASQKLLHQDLHSLQQELDQTRQVSAEYRTKLADSESRLRDLEVKLTHLAEDNEALQETLGSMKEKHKAQMEALETKYTKFNEDLETQIDSLKDQKESLEKDLDLAEGKLYDQTKHYEKYIKELADSRELDANSLQAEHEKLMKLTHAKDREIRELKSRCEELTEELKESKEMLESTFEGQKPLTDLLQERENELSELKAENATLLSQVEEQAQKLVDQEALNHELTESKKQVSTVREENIRLKTEVTVLKEKEDKNKIDTKTLDIITDLESEITSLHGKIRGKDKEIEDLKEMMAELETGITDLNEKSAEQVAKLQESEEKHELVETKMVVLSQSMLQKEQEIGDLEKKLERAKSMLDGKQQHYVETEEEEPTKPNFNLPAIEYKNKSEPVTNGIEDEKSRREENGTATVKEIKEKDMEDGPSKDELEQQVSDLRKVLHDKDEVIASMQENNDSLLKMLEDRSFSIYKDRTLVDLHKAQNQVKSLQVEREQILSVLNEKTREGSSLKSEVHRLMNVISAEKAAISKLQEDNQKLVTNSPMREAPDEDMTREAIQNLSHMVRNKEMEIEALKQKNETLLMVLQESSPNSPAPQKGATVMAGGGANTNSVQVGLLMQERENLSKQLAAYQQDREQIIAALTQKHQESVAYHTEIQRLTACLSTETQKMDKVQTDYDKLSQQFEDRQQSLVKAQNDLANYKQKYQELDERYQELSQHQFGQVDTVDLSLYNSKCEELSLLNDRLKKQSDSNLEKDSRIGELINQVSKNDELLSSRESELNATKKRLESLTFQLDGVHAELKDVEKDRAVWKQRTTEQQSENEMLKESLNRMSLGVQEKDFEINTLQEKCKTLTKMYEEKGDENSPQLQQMLKDCEAWQAQAQTFRQERDQAVLNMQQVHAENKNLINELQALRDQNQKAQKELERLRNHLLQTEESYVQEALQSEEREKQLLNRLHSAEEKALASDTAIQESDQLKDQHIESLKEQLYVMSQKKDEVTAQLIQTQSILQQYAASVTNLQMVLEKFQADKIAEEEMHQEQIRKAQEESMQLKAQIADLQNQMVEASDALDAAQRLSEQIDKKEDVVQALKEEVHQRDELLREAGEKIRQLTSVTEGQVDKLIMKNLFMGYFHTPPAKRQDVVLLISRVLDFTSEEMKKVMEESSGGGGRRWIPIPSIWGMGRSPSTDPPKTPTKQPQQAQKSFDQSFSELFVKFLERESSPQPQLKLPVDQMVREEQEKQQQQQKASFNPFAAPRHVAFPLQMASSEPSSELLQPHFGGLADLKLSPLPTLLADSSNTSSLNNTPNTSRPSSRQDKTQHT
ncbi:thyroid receptor-interacting protein 11 isoform X5 [Lingula anatina]|uniref:Thyroid receptor-interacting protein 11 isoform X5 n=1 Tax=Lingula anatina TaxID=7574 RepID=A0A2R2MM53_LINAN|nr:thyroid receptor-interacting protein 11 isoform X5 [Lingula anatina]|eukprot:XP_023931137.1 thyroid receptor-interacting protein 11 isoform X5 [Lingula anatina]